MLGRLLPDPDYELKMKQKNQARLDKVLATLETYWLGTEEH